MMPLFLDQFTKSQKRSDCFIYLSVDHFFHQIDESELLQFPQLPYSLNITVHPIQPKQYPI